MSSEVVKNANTPKGGDDIGDRPADVSIVEASIFAHDRKLHIKHAKLDRNEREGGNEGSPLKTKPDYVKIGWNGAGAPLNVLMNYL